MDDQLANCSVNKVFCARFLCSDNEQVAKQSQEEVMLRFRIPIVFNYIYCRLKERLKSCIPMAILIQGLTRIRILQSRTPKLELKDSSSAEQNDKTTMLFSLIFIP